MSWRERTDLFSRDTTLGQTIVLLRWGLFALYLVVVYIYWHDNGVPLDRTTLLFWVAIGIAVLSLGYNPVWLIWIVVDFFPFVAVLIVYDQLRGWSYTAGFPTWWHPQIEVDKFIFFGTEPTVWLQRHLKYPQVQWWDVAVCICYFSFFFIPYLLAAVMWLRSRADFYRWAVRFVALSFLGFALFVLIPAAPPWAAARCSAAEIANHPYNPPCLGYLEHPGRHPRALRLARARHQRLCRRRHRHPRVLQAAPDDRAEPGRRGPAYRRLRGRRPVAARRRHGAVRAVHVGAGEQVLAGRARHLPVPDDVQPRLRRASTT